MTYNYIMELSAEEENTNTENTENTENTNTENETTETVGDASNLDNFVSTLPIMGKGMLGIFIVTAAIILTIAVLNKFTSNPPKKENEEQ